jgi:putative sterol carrier protein
MAHLFGTDEWAKAYMEEINKSEAYAKSASRWEGDFYFVATPDKMIDDVAVYYMDLWHGKCRAACLVEDESQFSPAFRMETSDANWKAVIDRQLDPIRGMMTRRIKLQGNMAQIMRYVKASQDLVDCATRVPTEFPPERGS